MKKKGFTLIELLAVIVILAIIALILIPVVSDLIENARYASAANGVLNYISVVNNQASLDVSGFEEFSLNIGANRILETGVTDGEINKINYKGKGPDYVYIHFKNDENLVNDGHFCIWGYSIDYTLANGTSRSNNNYCNGESNEEDNATYTLEQLQQMSEMYECAYDDDFFENCEGSGKFATANYYLLKQDTDVYNDVEENVRIDNRWTKINHPLNTNVKIATIPAGTIIRVTANVLRNGEPTDYVKIEYSPTNPSSIYDDTAYGIVSKTGFSTYELRPADSDEVSTLVNAPYSSAFDPTLYEERNGVMRMPDVFSGDRRYFYGTAQLYYRVYRDGGDIGVLQISSTDIDTLDTYDGVVYYVREDELRPTLKDVVPETTPYEVTISSSNSKKQAAKCTVDSNGYYVDSGEIGASTFTVTGKVYDNGEFSGVVQISKDGNTYYVSKEVIE